MAKSKYADELTKRGFVRIGRHTLFASLIRTHGRRGGTPSFTKGTDDMPVTFATDESHYSWMATTLVDLTDLGFKDNTKEVHALIPL